MPAQPPIASPTRLESLTVGASVAGVDPGGPVRVIQAQWHSADCLDLTHRDATGRTDSRLLYRDDEPRDPETGRLCFIKFKSLAPHSREVHVPPNEILTGLNKPEDFILAVVRVDGPEPAEPRHLRGPVDVQISFTITGVDSHVGRLLEQAEVPA